MCAKWREGNKELKHKKWMHLAQRGLLSYLLVATIRAFARLRLREWSRPFTRMVATNQIEAFVKWEKRMIKFDEILGG